MNSILETMPQLAAYQPALLALSVICLMVLIQSLMSAPLAFVSQEQVPGMPLKGDHSLRSFRVLRTYSNSVENLPAFGFAVILAIDAGVSALLVNWIAIIHVSFRVLFWLAYYSGIGRIAGGPRTLFYVGGLITNMVLVGAGIYALIV